jgi:DivIVA domain-containing protein
MFTQAKRGYAEAEVRAYLRMVAEDLASAGARERELQARVRELEAGAHKPALPASDQDLIAALGEETARVLRQARESATELRGKAEEHARRVVREAQEIARELRTTTQQAVEVKTREAEDAARARAKEIVAEARATREAVLNDLTTRREQLERQINDLRAARAQLVETYQLVERALQHATRVMADEPSTAPQVPAPEPADSAVPVSPVEAPAARAPEVEVSSAPQVEPTAMAEAEVEVSPAAVVEAPRDGREGEGDHDSGRDVGALFQKLRSERPDASQSAEPDAAAEPAPDTAIPATAIPGTAIPGTAIPGATSGPRPETPARGPVASEPPAPEPERSVTTREAQAAREAREEALDAATDELVQRGKRALQDEQNDVLDGLRRQRGKIDVTAVLPPPDEQIARWAHVLQPAIDAAYSAGALSVEGKVGAAPRSLLTELASTAVTPLRDRLASSIESIDSRSPAEVEIAVAQRLGARYREWRGQELETMLGDVLAVAYSRGVYDAVADGTRLRWIPAHEGRCPDCDDNALEPTVKGSEFPTGQPHPPAHPGCRCLLVVDTA